MSDMNLQILSAYIVRRVQHSPDSVTNLCEVVANLIREEMAREEKMNSARDKDNWNDQLKKLNSDPCQRYKVSLDG